MSVDERITFGATVVTPSTPDSPDHLLKQTSKLRTTDSTTNLPSSSAISTPTHSDYDSNNPFSAFYSHPPARRSAEHPRPPALTDDVQLNKPHLTTTIYSHDLESQLTVSSRPQPHHHNNDNCNQTPRRSVDGRVKECTVWPSPAALKEKAAAERAQRSWNPLAGLDARRRLWAKMLIALVVVAAAVGIGIGVSRAVGGGVWAGEGRSRAMSVDHD